MRGATGEAVIVAAKKLFAEQGLDAQMPDVAKAAKVGVGTVYRHFPTKDDLIAALAGERFVRLAEKAREETRGRRPLGGPVRLHPLLRPDPGR